MKTKITLGTSQNYFCTVILFFICFLSSLNSYSQKIQTSLTEFQQNDIWENRSQTLSTYDNNGYLIHDLTQYWDTSWKNFYQNDYTNNPDGTVQQNISQSWNSMVNGWEIVERVSYTYSATKKVLTSEIEYIENNNWMLFMKQTNIYDENDYLIESLFQNGIPLSNAYKTTYTNNDDGTVKQSITQMWSDGVWYNPKRITYTYNNSKLITTLSDQWNEFTAIWENFSLDTYDYDGSGYLIHSLSQKWLANSWENDSQFFITNYGNGIPFQIISQDWHEMYLIWINEFRTTLTYTSLGVEERAFEKTFAVYPNPAKDKITIKTNDNSLGLKYWVTDQMGRQSLDGTITEKETVIDIDQLASGVYFIQMEQSKNKTIKIVKK